MPRPQFSIRTLLWLTLLVAAFFAGIGFERNSRKPHEVTPLEVMGAIDDTNPPYKLWAIRKK